jgi:hypothetical protein
VQAKKYIKMGKFSIIDGNAYAGVNLGDAYIQVGQDALITGDATASGAITINSGGQIYGAQHPNSPGLLPPFPPINEPDWYQIAQDYKTVAQSGGTYEGDYEIINGGTENLGPLYITGDLILNNNVTLTLTEIVYVNGQVTVGTNCKIIGPGFLIAEGDITMWSNDGVPGDSLPVIMSVYGDIYCKNGGVYRAVLYAPNGRITLEEGASLYGAAMGEAISTNNGFSAVYASELDDMMDCP